MFEQDYKIAMDNINPDSETREKILDKIILKEELKNRKNPALPWRIAFACVACIAIVLGIVFVPRDGLNFSVQNNTSGAQTLRVSKSYDEIYKLIKRKKVVLFENITIDDYETAVEEEYIAYGGNDKDIGANTSSSLNDGNDIAMPDATKGESTDSNTADKNDFSTTTEQVEGVFEADIVKTDGEYIYYVSNTTLTIFKADAQNTKAVSQTKLSNEANDGTYGELFLKDDRLILLKSNYYKVGAANVIGDYNYDDSTISVLIEIYDISDKSAPRKVASTCQDGRYNSARMVGDYIYLISNCNINTANIDKDDPTTFVPTIKTNDVCEPVPADSIYHYEQQNEKYNAQYTVIGAFNYKDGVLSDTASLLGGADNIYCSQGNIIIADTSYSENKSDKSDDLTIISQDVTIVSRLTIQKGKIEYKASGEIEGYLENQFFIDEHKGYFRFVTTVTRNVEKRYKFENADNEVISYSNETFAQLTVLDSELKKMGEITDMAKGESVYSVRFMGDIAYFVTFRQTDPLFSADISDPSNPKIIGELKIPGFSEYMYPYGDGLLLGFGMDADEQTGRTEDLKLSMFNITDPANVTEQDKTNIDSYVYSPALYNHKAMLVNKDKNIIGFAATDDFNHSEYIIFKYTDEGFVKLAALAVETEYKYAMDDVRGLFINDTLYILSQNALQVFDINTFTPITVLNF